MIRKIKLFTVMMFLFAGSMLYADNTVNDMLRAYGDGNYAKARRLAEKMKEKPEARLVSALCILFDPVKQDMAGGMAALGKLYLDKNLPTPVWVEAALTYGRVAQLIQGRKELYGGLASGVDTNKIFQEIIDKSPELREACTALFFDLTGEFDSNDEMRVATAFKKLEIFCCDFKGSQEYLVQLHLLADQKYIGLKQEYSLAVRHLEKAYKLGIANPRDSEITLYRIGRIYDLKLEKSEDAIKYYNEFLEKYPESGYAPSVKRFLKQLIQKSMEEKNGQR